MIIQKIKDLLKSYDVDYEQIYDENLKSQIFNFKIGKEGSIIAHDKTSDTDDCDFFMAGFEKECGIMCEDSRCMEDSLLHLAIMIKNKIKKYHYKGIQ